VLGGKKKEEGKIGGARGGGADRTGFAIISKIFSIGPDIDRGQRGESACRDGRKGGEGERENRKSYGLLGGLGFSLELRRGSGCCHANNEQVSMIAGGSGEEGKKKKEGMRRKRKKEKGGGKENEWGQS